MRPRAASRVAPALLCLLALACNSSSKRAPTPRASGVPSVSAASTTSAAPSSSAASAPSASAAATAPKLSTVRTDETVVVFPALGSWDAPKKSWRLELHVWIYEPEEDSKRRQILTDAIAKALKVGPNDKEREVLQRRLRPFLADNESGKRLAIQLDETQLTLPESADDGHALSTVYIPEALVPASGGARRMQIVLSDVDSRRFQAVAYFLPPKGTLVRQRHRRHGQDHRGHGHGQARASYVPPALQLREGAAAQLREAAGHERTPPLPVVEPLAALPGAVHAASGRGLSPCHLQPQAISSRGFRAGQAAGRLAPDQSQRARKARPALSLCGNSFSSATRESKTQKSTAPLRANTRSWSLASRSAT